MNKTRAEKYEKGYLVRFIRTYLLLMTISFLVAMITYYIAIQAVEDYAISANTTMLESRMAAIEYRMSEIDTFAKLLFTNPKILAFNDISDPYDGPNIIELLNLQSVLIDSYPLDNDHILDFFICYRSSQVAVSRFAVYSLEELHSNQYSYMSYVNWQNNLMGDYHNGSFLPTDAEAIKVGTVPYLTYTQSIGSTRKLKGTIMIQINNQALSDTIMAATDISKGFMYILNEDNTVLSSYSYGNEPFVYFDVDTPADSGYQFMDHDGEKYLITFLTSDVTGWKYVDIKTVGETLEKVYRIKSVTYLIIGLSAVIGILAAYFIALFNVKPIDRLIDNNALLQNEIIEQLPLLKVTFIERLISGLIISEEDLEAQCDHLGINLQGLIPQAIVIKITGYDYYQDRITIQQLNLERLKLTTVLKEALGTTPLLHNVDTDKVLLLLESKSLFRDSTFEYLNNALSDILKELGDKSNVHTVVGIGNRYDSLMNINSSYKEALQAINFRLYNPEYRFSLFSDLPMSNDVFYFPSDVETKLLNLIKSGNLEKVNLLLKEIYEENFMKRQLSPSMINSLLNLMLSSNIILMDDIPLNDEEIRLSIHKTSENFSTYSDIEKLQRTLGLYRSICEKMNESKKSKNESLINNVVKHIKNSIADQSLSLVSVADEFDITDIYLSGFFKEQTGITFSRYIEQMRMDSARQMLSTSDTPINEIVNLTGYQSSSAFGRAFKRINGMSATEYRQTFKH